VLASAEYLFNTALSKARESNQINEMAFSYLSLSKLYDQSGRYIKAHIYADSAISTYTQNDSINRSKALQSKGHIFMNQADYSNAHSYFIKSLTLTDIAKNYKGASDLMASITTNYIYQHDYASAIKSNDRSLEYAILSKDSTRLRSIYENLGLIYSNLGKYDSAIVYHQKAIKIAKKEGNRLWEAINLQNISNCHRELGNYGLALEIANNALEIKEENGNIRSILFTELLIANIYENMGKFQTAIQTNYKALEKAKKHQITDRERVALLYLSQCYESTKDFENAYKYHLAYTVLQDSLFNAERAEQIAKLQTQYETDQQEQQISLQNTQLLLKQNTIDRRNLEQLLLIIGASILTLILLGIFINYRKQKNTNAILVEQKNIIEQRSNERDTLLKEIHHRVKNNLQIISSLLNIQSRSLKDAGARSAIKEGQSRIKSMALIHQKLYNSDNLSKIDMKSYVSQLCEFLEKSFKSSQEIESNVKIDQISIDVNTAIPLGLIINELISNAYKYAFQDKDNGELNINLEKKENEKYLLEVIDNGIGIPKNFKIEDSDSLGLSLVHTLTEQIKGKLTIDCTKGTSFKIEFIDHLMPDNG